MSERYMIAMFGEGGYITIPRPFVIDFPPGRFASARAAADAFFEPDWSGFAPDQELTPEDVDSAYPLKIYGIPIQPFPGVDRYDVDAVSMASDVRAQFEITANWVRVYLHPPTRGSLVRADLEGQSVEGIDILDRIQCILDAAS